MTNLSKLNGLNNMNNENEIFSLTPSKQFDNFSARGKRLRKIKQNFSFSKYLLLTTFLFTILQYARAQDGKLRFYLNYNHKYNYISFKTGNTKIQSLDLERLSTDLSLNTRYFINNKLSLYSGVSKVSKKYSIDYHQGYIGSTTPLRVLTIRYIEIPLLASYTVLNKKKIKIFHSIGLTSDIYQSISNHIPETYELKYITYPFTGWVTEEIADKQKYFYKYILNATIMIDADVSIFKWSGINLGGVANFGITNCLKEPKWSRLITLQLKAGILINTFYKRE